MSIVFDIGDEVVSYFGMRATVKTGPGYRVEYRDGSIGFTEARDLQPAPPAEPKFHIGQHVHRNGFSLERKVTRLFGDAKAGFIYEARDIQGEGLQLYFEHELEAV